MENSLVGEQMVQLLKLIPLQRRNQSGYTSIEFDINEFVNLGITEIKELQFELLTNNGEFVAFQSGQENVVYFNLLFQKF